MKTAIGDLTVWKLESSDCKVDLMISACQKSLIQNWNAGAVSSTLWKWQHFVGDLWFMQIIKHESSTKDWDFSMDIIITNNTGKYLPKI